MSATPIDYTARDYETIKQDMIGRIPQHLPEWRDRSEHDFGIVMIELFAAMGDMLSFYIDRAANESSIQTAYLRESVLSFAALVGYIPDDMVPSHGAVTFTAEPGRLEDSFIRAGTVVYTNNPESDIRPMPFTTDEDLTILLSGSIGTVAVTQGLLVTNEMLGVSDGLASMAYSLFEIGVVRSSVFIDLITGDVTTRWAQVDSLLEAGASDQVFIVTIDAQGVAFVRFGDGANGLIPPAGANIRASYRIANGAMGNVASAGAVTTLGQSVEGIASVTNLAAITGGADAEDIDSIRRNLPQSIRAIERAVTPEDFEPLAEQVDGVLHAKATAAVYTSVNLYVVPVGGGTPSPPLEEEIEEFFSTRMLIGTDLTVLDPTYVPVNISLNLFVLPTFLSQETEDRVDDALSTFLSLEMVDLGKTINVSDIYRAIHEVQGVDYVEVTLVARADAVQTGTGPETYLVNEVPVKGTVTITTVGGI